MARAGWQPIVELLDAVASEPDVLDAAIRQAQTTIEEVGRLASEDVARHTRALFAAASRAIADQRGPSQAELDFIEELAVTRAHQQVPIEAVLSAVHLVARHVWRRARQLAVERELPAELVLDAREIFEDWADQARARLIAAHRVAEVERARSLRDRRVTLLRRVLMGGPEAAMAAVRAGLPSGAGLWTVYAHPADEAEAVRLEQALRTAGGDLVAVVDDALVGVLTEPPRGEVGACVGLAGPLAVERLDLGRQLARSAWEGGRSRRLVRIVRCEEVAVEAAIAARPELAQGLAARVGTGFAGEEEFGVVVAATVVAYAELDRRVDAAAARLFVHPNTVRHRLRRFVEATGLGLDGTFDAVAAWWAARSWLEQASRS